MTPKCAIFATLQVLKVCVLNSKALTAVARIAAGRRSHGRTSLRAVATSKTVLVMSGRQRRVIKMEVPLT